MKYAYKSETFGFGVTNKGLNKKIQALLDSYSKDGWRLHSIALSGDSASTCVVIFEKEAE